MCHRTGRGARRTAARSGHQCLSAGCVIGPLSSIIPLGDIKSPMPFGGMCHRTPRSAARSRSPRSSPMPFGGMCHRTCEATAHQCTRTTVTNAFRRDVSSDLLESIAAIQAAESPMPFGGMCHRTTTATNSPSPRRRSPMPFGGMCHRTRQYAHLKKVLQSSPMPFGGMCHRTRLGCISRRIHTHVTNAFRRDVSSDAEQQAAEVAQLASPMPFGGMCHRTKRQAPRDGVDPESPMPFGGMCHRTADGGGRRSGRLVVTNAFRRDVSSDPTVQQPTRVSVLGVTNAFRRDVSSDIATLQAQLDGEVSPMPFGGMCHRTHSRRRSDPRRSQSPMPFGGMCHRTPAVTAGGRPVEVTNAFRRDVSSDP